MDIDRSLLPVRRRKPLSTRQRPLNCEPLEGRICLSAGARQATTAVPVTPAPPTITSPDVGCTTDRSITITGTKQEGERILLNGRQVSGKRGTTWRVRVPLRHIGTYTLTFNAQTAPNPLGLSTAVTQV